MPTRKLDEPEHKAWTFTRREPCRNPDHDPPSMRLFPPGRYEHTCPECGKKQRFTVFPEGVLAC